jgi:transcriptional regulator with XRE-family HTH domain
VISRFVFSPEFAHGLKVRGLTLTALASRAGVCVATASSAVRGRPVNMETAIKLARVVNGSAVIPELERWIQEDEMRHGSGRAPEPAEAPTNEKG